MTDLKEKIRKELDQLRTVRDELKVQAHLGRKEAKELWERTEKNWETVEGKLRQIRKESEESLHEIGEAARGLAQEIRESYRRIRSLI